MFRSVNLTTRSVATTSIAVESPQSEVQPSDRLVFPLLMLALVVMYGLLQNPYWVPAGDSELYTAAARSMALGKGYEFNGQPIAMMPPGWSWMMSMVMRVTPYFLPLKLLAMVCVIGSLACAYWIVRRFVSPLRAANIILLTAVISHVYQATYWLISEGAFCLASTAALLVAMQIAEGRKQKWRIVSLLLLCAASITIRWAGVFGMLLIIAALLDRQWKPKLTTQWVVSALVVLMTLGTFFGWRHALKGTPESNAAASDMVTGTGEDIGPVVTTEMTAPVTGTADQSAKAYQIFPSGSYADRFLNWGRWLSYLYWQPFRAAAASVWILRLATVTGWVLIVLLAVAAFAQARRMRWIFLATFGYAAVLALGWTNVNARYYVPIAFLLTLAIVLATDQLVLWSRSRAVRGVLIGAFVLFIASVAFCNGALYAVEVAIARSDRFYARYETGLNQRLIRACQYLMALPDPPKDDEIAVSQRYTNLNRSRPSPFGLRATVLLTGREIVTPRFKDTAVDPTAGTLKARAFRAWLKSKGVKYYLYQPEISPWRVWHFRLGWYEKWQTGRTAEKDTSGWRVYRVDDDRMTELAVPQRKVEMTRVPGL